jgi:hypothetical protein
MPDRFLGKDSDSSVTGRQKANIKRQKDKIPARHLPFDICLLPAQIYPNHAIKLWIGAADAGGV